MPKPPQLSATSSRLQGGVYSSFADQLDPRREVFALHVGDTYLQPPSGSSCWEIAQEEDLHRYTATNGRADLRAAIAAATEEKTGCAVHPDQVYVTAGATAGLSATMQALLTPGDEVLILAPYWPLIAGMTRVCGGVVRAVDVLGCKSPQELSARLEAAHSERTVALYYSSPNNPSGRVLSQEWIDALIDFAAQNGLWLIADDVYDLYCYTGPHASAMGRLPESTITANSASKAFAMTGNRCGWLVAPPAVIDAVHRLGTHAFYSAPTVSQVSLLAALQSAAGWVEATSAAYCTTAKEVAAILGQPPPEGGTFLFFDLADALGPGGLEGFLKHCAQHNLLLAPGPSFGPYPTSVRLCFTAAPPAVVSRAAELLADLLESHQEQCAG